MDLSPSELAQLEEERSAYRKLVGEAVRSRSCIVDTGVKITCIGNAGGACSQVQGRPSGGFLLQSECRNIIVDPGNNSMSELIRLGLDPCDITDVLASHAHSDHVGDLTTAVSAAVRLGMLESADSNIVVSPSLVDYNSGTSTRFGYTLPMFAWRGKVVPLYWKDIDAESFDGTRLHSQRSTLIGDKITVTAAEARHGQVSVTGFIIDTPYGRIGYTSDTEYFDGLSDCYQGCDILWMNMNTISLESMNDTSENSSSLDAPVNNHLGYLGVCKLISEVRPGIAIVSHFGAQLIGRRMAVEKMLRERFSGEGITIFCPDNGDSFIFGESLSEPPVEGKFSP